MNEIGTMESGLFYNNMISDCENCFAEIALRWSSLCGGICWENYFLTPTL